MRAVAFFAGYGFYAGGSLKIGFGHLGIQFATADLDVGWGLDSDSDTVASRANDRQDNVVANSDFFVFFTF